MRRMYQKHACELRGETQSVCAAVVPPLQFCSCDSTADIPRMAKNELNKMSYHVVRILSFDVFLEVGLAPKERASCSEINIIYKQMGAQRVQEPTVTDIAAGDHRVYPLRKKAGRTTSRLFFGFSRCQK